MGISSRFLPCGQSSVAATIGIIFLPITLIVCIMISVKQIGVAVREVDLITQIWSFDHSLEVQPGINSFNLWQATLHHLSQQSF